MRSYFKLFMDDVGLLYRACGMDVVKRHSALSNVLTSPNYEIEQAIVLCEGNVNETGKALYLPAYMVMFI